MYALHSPLMFEYMRIGNKTQDGKRMGSGWETLLIHAMLRALGGSRMEGLDAVIKALESIKRMAPNGEDFWMARDIQPILG
jgi:hypothetical protein